MESCWEDNEEILFYDFSIAYFDLFIIIHWYSLSKLQTVKKSVINNNFYSIINWLLFFIFGQIRLIIIDSITFHFRYGFDGSYALRTRLLNGIMQVLIKVAQDYKVAVSI